MQQLRNHEINVYNKMNLFMYLNIYKFVLSGCKR